MFEINNVLERQAWMLRCQKIVIVMVSIVAFLLWWGWWQAPKHLTIYLPPDLGQGITQETKTIPKPFLYSFTIQVWQAIQYWPEATPDKQGDFPYKQNILRYATYLSPNFKTRLLKDYNLLLKAGHLDRTRDIEPLAYVDNHVKQLTAKSWEVDIDVILVERAGNMIVKKVRIRYPLRVIRRDVNRNANPYGLVVDGFAKMPVRLNMGT